MHVSDQSTRRDLFGVLVAPRLLKRFDGPGRPKGIFPTQGRKEKLHAYLIWIGRPDLSDREIITILRAPHDRPDLSDEDTVRMLRARCESRDDKGEQLRIRVGADYAKVSDRALRRDIAAQQRKIWGTVRAQQRKIWGRRLVRPNTK